MEVKKSNTELSVMATSLFFDDVKSEEYRSSFLAELKSRAVVDKRSKGYYCSYCGKSSQLVDAFPKQDKVIFPKESNTEVWIVNSHYDGCMGWD